MHWLFQFIKSEIVLILKSVYYSYDDGGEYEVYKEFTYEVQSRKTEEEKREAIKGVYEEVFTALKPNDLAAIGVFQRDADQIGENAELYNEWYSQKYGR